MIRVAALQLGIGKRSYDRAVDDAAAMIHRAKEEDAQIVCLPEHWLLEYKPEERNITDQLANIAKSNQIYIITGANYTRADDIRSEKRLRIRSSLLNPNGMIIGEQDKVHLFRDEKRLATPGDRYRVFPTPLGNIGISICYDNVFPESIRTLSLMGADIIFSPSRIITEGLRAWILYMRTRTLENRIPIVAPNIFHPPRYVGNSVILDVEPDAATNVVMPKIVGSSAAGESLITADLNIELSRTLRKERLEDRNPKAYD